MALFVRLAKLTPQGTKQVKELGQLLGAARQVMEAHGVKIVQAFATLGRYDIVAVVDAPDEQTMGMVSALIAAQGNFTAETLAAIPIQEFAKSLQQG